MRDPIHLTIREYYNHPYAVPNWPVHGAQIRIASGYEIAVMLQRVKEAAAGRR